MYLKFNLNVIISNIFMNKYKSINYFSIKVLESFIHFMPLIIHLPKVHTITPNLVYLS